MNRLIVACASALFLVACTAETADNTPPADPPAVGSAAANVVKMDLGKPA